MCPNISMQISVEKDRHEVVHIVHLVVLKVCNIFVEFYFTARVPLESTLYE